MFDAPLRRQLDAFLDDQRRLLLDSLDGLTEEQAGLDDEDESKSDKPSSGQDATT